MIDINLIRTSIFEHFKAGWIGVDAIPVRYPNHRVEAKDGQTYGKLAITYGTRKSVAIGAARVRSHGFVSLQVFTTEHAGTIAASKAAKLFSSVFDLKVLLLAGGVSVHFEHTSNPRDTDNRGGNNQTNIYVDFRIDEDN